MPNKNEWINAIEKIIESFGLANLHLDYEAPQFDYKEWTIGVEKTREFRGIILRWRGPPESRFTPPDGFDCPPKLINGRGWHYRVDLIPNKLSAFISKLDSIRYNNEDKSGTSIADDLKDINNQKDIEETTRETLIQARIGQGRFRAELFAKWENCCAVTGCSVNQVLRASHVQPWRLSDNEQRLDPNNGLPLIATLDALFDAGFISFHQDGQMLISNRLPLDQLEILGLGCKPRLSKDLTTAQIEYMKFHRERIFRPDI